MTFRVILHEGVVDEAVRPRLLEGIRRVAAGVFGVAADAVTVEVTEIRKGRFFTAGRPSRSALIGTTVPASTSRTDRTRLMAEITARWCEVTGAAPDEVLVSASDG